MSAHPIDRQGAIEAAVADLRDGGGELWRLSGDELAARMAGLEDLRRLCEAQQVALAQEALSRGETGPSAPLSVATLGVKSWVAACFRSCAVERAPEPGHVAALGDAAATLVAADDGREQLCAAVTSGHVPVRTARLCLAEFDRLKDLLVAGASPAVWGAYASLASREDARVVASLREAMLTRYGLDGRLEREHETARRHASLSGAVRDGALRKYLLTLDAERAAQLEAAVGALSAPVKGEHGEPDERPVGARRADALMAVVTRGLAAGASTPGPTKAAVFVTIDVQSLVAGRGAGAVIGSVEDGTILPATSIARLACDAWLVPAFTRPDGSAHPVEAHAAAQRYASAPGEYGSVLDVGRARRLFTLQQKRALVLRDRGCTFPGCRTPATWCDAHHLRHWLDGGASDLSNAALLCGRHHTLVHSRRFAGRVLDGRVEWDKTPGSYDELLRQGPGRGELAPGSESPPRP